MKKNVLITGGCGFIGSHLVDRVLCEGCAVTVIDNLATGRQENLAHQKNNPDLKIHIADICDYSSIERHFEKVDYVFHLAARADIVPSIEKPIEYHQANVDGTINVLLAARKYNVKRFMYTASSSCYGIPDHYPTKETDEMRPQYPYALTKWIGEQYTMHWGKVYT